MVYFIDNIKRSQIANYLIAVGAVAMKQCTVFTKRLADLMFYTI